ncbi:MAG: hypothetical protein JNM78_17015 [Cyclobacteriaceae bacterium]|nr:hypothetical protein [Cyclobacteriaceae bacterium]
MSKNVIIGILTLLSVGSIYFGVQQNSKIDERVAACERKKSELIKTAQEEQLKASEFQKMAELAQAEAMVQRALADAQIEELKKRK